MGLREEEECDYSEPRWCVTMVLFSNPSTFSTLPQSNLEPRGVTAEDSFWYNKIQFGCKKNRARLCLRHPSAAWILLNCWGKIFDFLVNTLLICLKNLIPWKKKGKEKVHGQIYVGVTEFLFKTSGPSDMAENPLYMKLAILRAKTNFSEEITGPG